MFTLMGCIRHPWSLDLRLMPRGGSIDWTKLGRMVYQYLWDSLRHNQDSSGLLLSIALMLRHLSAYNCMLAPVLNLRLLQPHAAPSITLNGPMADAEQMLLLGFTCSLGLTCRSGLWISLCHQKPDGYSAFAAALFLDWRCRGWHLAGKTCHLWIHGAPQGASV